MKFTVNGFEYEIEEVDKNNDNLKMDDGYHWGICDYEKRKIFIWKDLSFSNKKQTLLHEVTHAFIEANGFIQVRLTDEIVSDFVAAYISDIQKVVNNFFAGKNK